MCILYIKTHIHIVLNWRRPKGDKELVAIKRKINKYNHPNIKNMYSRKHVSKLKI